MKIKDAFRYEELELFLNAPMEFFREFGKLTHTQDRMMYIHQDIGANILAVAHLDSVNPNDHFYVCNFGGEDTIFSTHLDDRLGAYIILAVLPRMGIHTDILLTEGEEVGKSTAAHFKASKQYRWMFSFDRRGTDAVHYRYNDPPWVALLRKTFGTACHGSVSDIDYLSHLKCCGLNIGTGYYDEHSIRAYANMNDTRSQIGKFIQFYQEQKSNSHPYAAPVPVPYKPWTPNGSGSYTTHAVPPISEEKEDDVAEFYNPYAEMDVDTPLDMCEYEDQAGVIIQPEVCAFCLEPLKDNTHAFMGICKDCERFAIQCTVCNEFFDRLDFPDEDMGLEMFWGICRECEETLTRSRRFTNNVNDDELQATGKWDGGDNDNNEGDESTPSRRID